MGFSWPPIPAAEAPIQSQQDITSNEGFYPTTSRDFCATDLRVGATCAAVTAGHIAQAAHWTMHHNPCPVIPNCFNQKNSQRCNLLQRTKIQHHLTTVWTIYLSLLIGTVSSPKPQRHTFKTYLWCTSPICSNKHK